MKSLAAIFLLCAFLGQGLIPAQEKEKEFDAELILAADISASMSEEELRIQRDSYVKAIKDERFWNSIRFRKNSRIRLLYMEWSSSNTTVNVPWEEISSYDDLVVFAGKLAISPLNRNGEMTNIGDAMLYANSLFTNRANRKILDISGDGENNFGSSVVTARDTLMRNGVVINGIPILSENDVIDLHQYYTDCVATGFVTPAMSFEKMADALAIKLNTEISGNFLPVTKVAYAKITCDNFENRKGTFRK